MYTVGYMSVKREAPGPSDSPELDRTGADDGIPWSDLQPETELERAMRGAITKAKIEEERAVVYERHKSEKAARVALMQSDEVRALLRRQYELQLTGSTSRGKDTSDILHTQQLREYFRMQYAIRLYGGYPPDPEAVKQL